MCDSLLELLALDASHRSMMKFASRSNDDYRRCDVDFSANTRFSIKINFWPLLNGFKFKD